MSKIGFFVPFFFQNPGQGPPNQNHPGGPGPRGPPQPWQTTTEEFLVPPDKVGAIIGKGGQNLKNLRSQFNVQLELIQKDDDQPGVAKPLRIQGTLQQINGTRMECFKNMLPKEEKTPQKMGPGGQVRFLNTFYMSKSDKIRLPKFF